MADFTRGKHQVMTTQKRVETVTAGHKPGTEQGTKHDPKLITANPRVFLADFPYVSNDYTLMITRSRFNSDTMSAFDW